jgi:enoyl-CoA hydratase/3-hydroxyacyl-CoA dehydrogenase
VSLYETDYDTIRVESPTEHLAHVVLDRPDDLNTVSHEMLDDLDDLIDVLEDADVDEARTVLITGAGEKAFSAGADLGGGAMEPREAVEHSRRGKQVFARFRELDMPVVAGIDGYCLGGGFELSMCTDLRIASESAEFGLVEHDRGLLPGWGGTQFLQPLIGESAAKQIVFTADRFEADRMHEFGYLVDVYDDEGFLNEAIEFADDIARGPPIAQKYTKRAMREGSESLSAGLELESHAFGYLLGTEDLMEGITAFMQDREPEFEGK